MFLKNKASKRRNVEKKEKRNITDTKRDKAKFSFHPPSILFIMYIIKSLVTLV